MKTSLVNYLTTHSLIFDGAMGTQLEGKNPTGEPLECLNTSGASLIQEIHKSFVDAGADIVSTNTFSANCFKLTDCDCSIKEVVESAVKNAKAANPKFIALDIGPLGQLLKPLGTLEFESAVEAFKTPIEYGIDAGVDAVLLETFSDLYELKAAIIAAKEIKEKLNKDSVAIIASLTFEKNNRTFVGADALTAVTLLNAIGVDAIGINCSTNPFDISPIVDTFIKYSKVPVLVMPNAGLPHGDDLSASGYSVTKKDFAKALFGYYKKGARIFGGCCGTSPEYIKELKTLLQKENSNTKKTKKIEKVTAVTSGTSTVIIDKKVTIIGERLNPTGKPKLKQALKDNDFDFIAKQALEQIKAGSHILDVNCGTPEVDEVATLPMVIKRLQGIIDTPLQIDSTNVLAIEAAVRAYNGKPLINSVNGKASSLKAILPIAKKYGAAVLGLTMDENGIPLKAQDRFKIAKRIVDTAAEFGIDKEDILIDCLTLTASAQQLEVEETLKAIKLVKEKLKVKTVLGVSNVSFGLPNRPKLNSVFLAAALSSGLDAPIVNPNCTEILATIKSYNVINASDLGSNEYIDFFSEESDATSKMQPQDNSDNLTQTILMGQQDASLAITRALLKSIAPLEVINTHLIPSLKSAGDDFEKGKIFLPKLLLTAQIAKECFSVINDAMALSGANNNQQKDKKIILATVKGDVHDIGKNIAKVLLQSYGFSVVDLGKDIEPIEVVKAAKAHSAQLVGLSALMTTTLPAMQETIALLKQELPNTKIMVGGAVLTEDYSKKLGADFYAKDAMVGVKIADKVINDK